MGKYHYIKKHIAIILAGGFLTLNAANVWAAPVELSLDESINMALANNPAIKIAMTDKDKAVWTIDEAQNNNKPSINYTHTATHLKTANGSVGAHRATGEWGNWPAQSVSGDKYDNSISLSIPLYTGGKVEGMVDKAKEGLKYADVGIEKSKQQIKLDATSAYYSILQARNAVRVSQESVDMVNGHLTNVQSHFSVGTVAKSDVLRVEVELANAQQNLIKAQNSYNMAVSAFNNVVGLPLNSEINVKEELKYNKYNMSLDECINYSLANRPDIIQTQYAVEMAKKDIQVAKSNNLPNVAIKANQDWNDNNFPGMDNSNWSITLAASWNFFDSGVTDAKVKQSDSALQKTELQLKQIKDSVQLDVRQSYLSMQEAEKRIQTTEVAVSKADEDFKIAQVRYNAGVGTNIDVIDAQVALTNAKNNYNQAMYDYNVSKAKVEKAMGVKVENSKQ